MLGARWFPLRPLGSLIAAGLAAAAPARAESVVVSEPGRLLEGRIHEGALLEQYVAQIMAPLRQADARGDGLDAGDLEARRQAGDAQERANHLAQVMRFDLDGDLAVEPAEVAKVSGAAADRDARQSELQRYDVDGDGVVTVKEVLEASARIRRVSRARREDEVEALMALPEARDGRLTAAELADAARLAFARADGDGDGRISREEVTRFRAALPPEPPRPHVEDVYCPMPQARGDDLIVMFGAYEGETVRGAGGSPTGRATVRIDPGRQPIYLILPSYEAVRWNLTGAVARLRQVVVVSHEGGGPDMPRGAAGLPPQRVRTFDARGCVGYFYKLQTPEAEAARAAVALRLGRQPDVVAGAYTATDVTLPPVPEGLKPRQRPEAAGPVMRPGAWRFTDDVGDMPMYVVAEQEMTRLIFRVGGGICMARFRWRREGPDAWRFQSRCASGAWEQVAEGRATGDFQNSLSFTARVVTRGFENPTHNGETIVRVQAQYVEEPPVASAVTPPR